MKHYSTDGKGYNPYPAKVSETFQEYLECLSQMVCSKTAFWQFVRPSKFSPQENDNETRAQFLSEEYCVAFPARANFSLGMSLYCHSTKTAPYTGNVKQLHYLGFSPSSIKTALNNPAELGLTDTFKVRNFHVSKEVEKLPGYSTWGIYIQGPLRVCRKIDPVNPMKALFEGAFFKPDLGELRRMAELDVYDDWMRANPTPALVEWLKSAGKNPINWRVAAVLCFYGGIPFSNFVRGNWMLQNDIASVYEWCKMAFPSYLGTYDMMTLEGMVRKTAVPSKHIKFRGNLRIPDVVRSSSQVHTLSENMLSEVDLFSTVLKPSVVPVSPKDVKPKPKPSDEFNPTFFTAKEEEVEFSPQSEYEEFIGFGGLPPKLEDID